MFKQENVMRKIKLYIAVSLDGYIATSSGDVDWLNEIPNPNGIDHGYKELMESVDIVLMGGKTYHQIINFGGQWPYKEKTTYVIARHDTNILKNENIHFLTEDFYKKLVALKAEEGKDSWLVGGGELTTMLLNNSLIDEMQLCQVPMILGKGLPLFPNNPLKSRWMLKDSKSYDTGLVVNTYEKI